MELDFRIELIFVHTLCQAMHTGPTAVNMMYQMHLALNCSPHNLLQ
jgi:hypothetical protein